MGDAADDALAYGEAVAEDRRNARDQRRHELAQALDVVDMVLGVGRSLGFVAPTTDTSGREPTCRCDPGRRHALCVEHGEKDREREPCSCWHPDSGVPEAHATLDPSCAVHGWDGDPYGRDAPERRDPWLTHYDPFVHTHGLRASSQPTRPSPVRRS